jgi:hypothetical protein
MTANAGYHLFNTGDVLTAAQVQYNLQNQSIMYFASSAARTSALSGVLVEGMFSYLADTDSTEYYSGSAWTSISNPGDITAVTTAAGSGLSGGASSGAVALSLASSYTAKTAAYTFVAGDEYNLFSMNAATSVQFNIPTDATYNFTIGTEFNVFWITGVGQPTIGAVTPGTTAVISTGATSATPKLRVANSGATIKKLAANSWIVFGDLA